MAFLFSYHSRRANPKVERGSRRHEVVRPHAGGSYCNIPSISTL